jgi:hypothetical protein
MPCTCCSSFLQAIDPRGNPDLFTRHPLVADVNGGGRIVTHLDHRQPGLLTGGGQALDARNERATDFSCQRVAIENPSRHVALSALSKRGREFTACY